MGHAGIFTSGGSSGSPCYTIECPASPVEPGSLTSQHQGLPMRPASGDSRPSVPPGPPSGLPCLPASLP